MVDAISHEKRLDIARYYLLGSTYAEIEKKTGVSHGSVANVIKELETGHLTIPGVPLDEVNDLRLLALDLAKKSLKPSQALLGVTLFKRFTELEIAPSEVDQWSKLVKIYAPEDFPVKDFFEAALHLHNLEKAEKKPFQEVAEEYATLKQKTGELTTEVNSLDKKKNELAGEVESLTSGKTALENQRDEVKGSVEAEYAHLEEAKALVTTAKEELSQLKKETEDLQKKKVKLCSEVGGKEESLAKLKEIGFSEEDFLQLRNLVENMAEKEGVSPGQVKDSFFSTLAIFGNLSGLQKAVQEEAKVLQDTIKQKAFLAGEIAELEARRASLQAEVGESASAAAEQIREAAEQAVSMIWQEADSIREEVKSVLEDTLAAGMAVGEMAVVQKEGEKAGKELEELIGEVKRRLRGDK